MLNCPSNLNLEDFDYDLPEEKIAIFPNEIRENSKLLVFDGNQNKISHNFFTDICNFLPENSLIVINSTKVIPARFLLKKETGGMIELLCIEPILPSPNPQISIFTQSPTTWECIVGGRKVYEGMELFPISNEISFKAKILKRYENKAIVEFSWKPQNIFFNEILNNLGKIPLPPYLKREVGETDNLRYQTIYANNAGSVAAPTAGLHFSENILNEFNKKNIELAKIILHIGPGTFVPIESEIAEHQMHSEQIFVTKETIEKLTANYSNPKNFTVATGTTSLRTLETLYWIGIKILLKDIHSNDFQTLNGFHLEQNYSYQKGLAVENLTIEVKDVFSAILDKMNELQLEVLQGRTQLFIVPSYQIRTVNALITNFHLPKSTLLLLVSAFVGTDNCKAIYKSALQNDYKFLSYGDSSLLIR